MPLAWGDDYYLVGDFTNWANNDDYLQYQFTGSNGTYTITKDIPANAQFKILRVYIENETTKRAFYGTWVGSDKPFEFSRVNNTYGDPDNNEYAKHFVLPGVAEGGKATFTFTLTNGNPKNLVVIRDIQYYLLYNNDAITNDQWNNVEVVAMEKNPTTNDWTISRTFPAETTADKKIQFAFNDEYGSWYGGNGWWIRDDNVGEHLDGEELAIGPNGNFVMTVPGDFVLKANSDFNKLVVMPTLATIEKNNRQGHTYLIANELQVVYNVPTKSVAFARDFDRNGANTSISEVLCPAANADGLTAAGAIDFMRYGKIKDNPQAGPWQQNNWVMLDLSQANSLQFGNLSDNCVIKGGTLKGTYSNYTFQVSNDNTYVPGTAYTNYELNVYSPANFHSSNTQQGANGKYYWFMPPKPMEVCKFTWAMWYNQGDYANKPGFYMQDGESGLVGGIGADMTYNYAEDENHQALNLGLGDLTSGASYRFTGVIMKTGSGKKTDPDPSDPNNHHPQDGSTLNTNFKVETLNLDPNNTNQVITGVSDVKTGSDVVSVTYCDLAGRVSQKPFAGVNIIVTRYSDGTVKTTKAIK